VIAIAKSPTDAQELSERGEVLTLCALPLASAVYTDALEEDEGEDKDGARAGGPPATPLAAAAGTTPATAAAVGGMTPDGRSTQQQALGSWEKDGVGRGSSVTPAPTTGANLGGVGVGTKRGRGGGPALGLAALAEGEHGTTAGGGVIPPPPLVSLLQEAVLALQRRALNMDLAAQPYRCVWLWVWVWVYKISSLHCHILRGCV